MKRYILQEGREFNLNYEDALKLAQGIEGEFITRAQWEGFHFTHKGDYFIYTKDDEILVNPEEIFDTDKNDWGVVDVHINQIARIAKYIIKNYL